MEFCGKQSLQIPDTVNAERSVRKYQPLHARHGTASATSRTPTARTMRAFFIQWSVKLGMVICHRPQTSRKLASMET